MNATARRDLRSPPHGGLPAGPGEGADRARPADLEDRERLGLGIKAYRILRAGAAPVATPLDLLAEGHQPVDRALAALLDPPLGEHVDVPALSWPSEDRYRMLKRKLRCLPRPSPKPRAEAVQLPGAVVGEHVVADDLPAADLGEPRIADHVAAADGAARDGADRPARAGPWRCARVPPLKAANPSNSRPAEVRAARSGDRQVVDLLVAVVAARRLSRSSWCGGRRRSARGLRRPYAQISSRPGRPTNGIVRRDRVGFVRRRCLWPPLMLAWIDAQQLAEEEVEVLRVVRRSLRPDLRRRFP